MKWRPFVIVFVACAVVGLGIWLQHARLMGHWLQVHTGTVNEPGPYYQRIRCAWSCLPG